MRWMVLASVLCATGASAQERPVAVAHPRGDAEVVLDGRLDEEIWAAAPAHGRFRERQPRLDVEPPVATEFRVLYDADALWVGVRCALMPGETPVANELTRDSFRIFEDDVVTLKIDVHHDRRTTVAFAVNAAGAQLDYLALEDGAFRREFDAVWRAEVHVAHDEWSIEFRLPVAALGIAPSSTPGAARIFGFEVTRDHNARVATYDWALLPPEFGPVSAPHYGELRGVRGISGGRPFSVIPYLRYALEQGPDGHVDYHHGAGGDLRVRLARDVWGELTVLTDFAQVDLDDPAVNLDRFPLFLPEKRPFFLSGLDVFEFGAIGQAQIFFSRRIGLDARGNEVPVLAGLKAYGRSGALRFGILDVITGADGDTPAANWAIARVRGDFGESSYAGAMIAARDRLTGGEVAAHESIGADTRIRLFDQRLELTGFVAGTLQDGAGGEGGAARGSAGYRGEALRASASTLWVGDDFAPAVGFVRRAGILHHEANVSYVHRTEALGLETITPGVAGYLRTSDESDRQLGWGGSLITGAEWASGWSATLGLHHDVDVVEESFDLFTGVPVAAGEYRGWRGWGEVSSPDERNPSAWVYYGYSTFFFGGTYHNPAAGLVVALGPHVRFATDADVYLIDLPAPAPPLTTIEYRTTLTLAASTRLFADLVFQLEEVDGIADQNDAGTAMARVRWQYAPGSDVIFVWRTDFSTVGRSETNHAVTLKLTYRADAVL